MFDYSSKDAHNKKTKIGFEDFQLTEAKDKKSFFQTISTYEKTFPNKKAHVEFISSGLAKMEEYGVQEDLEAYKSLMNVFPKDQFVPRNVWQQAMTYFPVQQYLAIDILEKMEHNGVLPDIDLGEIIFKIFGRTTRPFLKYETYLYWTLKFKNKSPWYLPKILTCDPIELAEMAVKRITSVDIQTEITRFQTKDLLEAVDDTWIVSGQSPKQRELLRNHKTGLPVIVEGGDRIWLRKTSLTYFLLKGDCEDEPPKPIRDRNDFLKMETMYFNPNYTELAEIDIPCVHKQENGKIYAICITGTTSKDSLLSWVRLLQKNGNPILGEVPVLFRMQNLDTTPVPVPETSIPTQLKK
ncbi:hypothetical protein RUM43_000827 [Polyplax serrata]|uniref:Evolutionarily conserved signaling intermediate in Toll pathway, mitochondrial n=1 Tax=Polyplax serrata TaxID=468196 RepID=A0AAN8XPN0_POLSC